MSTTTTTTPETPPRITATAAANQALHRAVEYAEPYGRIKSIAETMTAVTGQPISRQMVGRWLHPDPEKRVPIGNFGIGLALLYCCQALNTPSRAAGDLFNLEIILEPEPREPAPKAKRKTTKQPTTTTNA